MSEQTRAILLHGPGEGMYVLTLPADMLMTDEALDGIEQAWAAATAGERVLVVPEGMRLEWVGPGAQQLAELTARVQALEDAPKEPGVDWAIRLMELEGLVRVLEAEVRSAR